MFYLKKSSSTVAVLLAVHSSAFSYVAPSASLTGMVSDNFSVLGDVLQPLSQDTSRLYYADFQGQGSNTDAGILSLGLGIRQLMDHQRVLGGYFFVDRERSSNKSYYTVLGPGVELLSQTWRFRLNGYFPVGDKEHLVDEGWADEFGNYEYVVPHDNQVDDRWAYLYESLSYGGDFSIAYRFARDDHWEVELRPYAYNQDYNNDILGANAQVTFYNDNYGSLFIGDGYDNVNHNRIYAGMTFNFGKRNTENTVANLMISPVPRNLNVTTVDNGLPSDSYFEYGEESVEDDDVVFVEVGQGGEGEGTGTYEDPYMTLDQVNANEDPNAHFRIESDGDTVYQADEVTLIGEQTMGGFTDDYRIPAAGDDQPTLLTELAIEGDNEVSNLKIEGEGHSGAGIVVSEGASLTTDNVIINDFGVGVLVEDDASIDMIDSEINASSDDVTLARGAGAYADVTGIDVYDNATVTLEGTDVNVTNDSSGAAYGIQMTGIENATVNITDGSVINFEDGGQAYGAGINADNCQNCAIDINNSSVIVDSASSDSGTAKKAITADNTDTDITVENGSVVSVESASTSRDSVYGIYNYQNSGDVTISASTVSASSQYASNNVAAIYSVGSEGDLNVSNGSQITSSTGGGNAYALYSYDNNGVTTIDNSTLTATAPGNAYGIYGYSDGALTIDGSTITATSTGGNAAGIYSYYGSGIAITNSTVTSSAQTGESYGIQSYNSDGALTIDDSTITAASSGRAVGIYTYDDSSVAIIDSEITASSTEAGDSVGIESYSNRTLTIEGSAVSATSAGNVTGVYSYNDGELTIDGSTITATSAGRATGINLYDDSGIAITNSTVTSSAQTGESYGIQSSGNDGVLTIDDSTITSTATSRAISIYSYDDFGIAITNSAINSSTQTGESYGIQSYYNDGALTIGDSTITATSGGSVDAIYVADAGSFEVTDTAVTATSVNGSATGIRSISNASTNFENITYDVDSTNGSATNFQSS